MLPYQTPNLLPGRHQRQKSTPAIFDTPRTLLPATQQQHEPHKRGLSLGQAITPHENNGLSQQDDNLTYDEYMDRQRLIQALMREAQQQQQTARPGQENQLNTQQESYQNSIQQAPCQEHAWDHPNKDKRLSLQDTYRAYATDMFQPFDPTPSAGNLDGFGPGHDGNAESIQPNEIQNTKEMPRGIPSRVGAQTSSEDEVRRPCTPISQTRITYFPMTPATTPFSQNAHKKHALHSRTAESSPTRRDPNLTIKASHAMQRGASYDDDFAVMRQKAETPKMPSTPNSARHKHRGSVDLAAFPQPDFMNMSNLQMNIPTGEGGYDASNYSPMSNTISSTMSSFQSSPEMTHLSLFEAIDVGVDGSLTTANLSALPASQSAVELGGFSSPIKEAPQLRSQSVSEINPEECGEDTGVTCDDIAAFISYVQSDSRWMCLFPDCGKRFGRKENIKAHVQTHLGDRQFRCRDCGKCFVRQHDLKRHANIHSGFKSYPCPCGKQFARHDALTRHRQRGMCIGAFEGTPKKVIKRGRPKKPRPDTEERLEKSAKTRQRALEKRCPGKYASSVSGSSASSSPEELFEDMDFTPSSPSPGDGTLQGIVRNIAVDPFSYTPPTSPGYSTGNCLSSQVSQHSYTPKAISTSPSPKFTGIPEEPQTLPVSNSSSRKSSSSYFGTPPELDVSSSSPAASKFFDLDASSEAASSQSMPLPFDHNMVLLNQDFDLSPALTKEESMNAVKSDFHDYFNAELEMTGFSFAHDKYADAFNSDDPFTDGFMNC